jgi:recombinational DNA repair protein (RecF pathway)
MLALVLETREYRENSLLVTLLTPDQGRVAAIAKGAHRPKSALAGTLRPFACIDARLTHPPHGGLATLSTADTIHCPDYTHQKKAPVSSQQEAEAPHPSDSLARLAYASLFAEILTHSAEDDPHAEPLFHLSRAFFAGLETTPHPGSFVLSGLFALLGEMGYAPELEDESAEGFEGLHIAPELRADLYRVLVASHAFPDVELVSRRAGAPLLRLAMSLFEAHLERGLRGRRFVEEMVLAS